MIESLKPKFIEPMECLAVSKLPDGPSWVYEIKLDGYRAQAIRSGGSVSFYSCNGKSLNKKFSYIVEALEDLPPDTVIDSCGYVGLLNSNTMFGWRTQSVNICPDKVLSLLHYQVEKQSLARRAAGRGCDRDDVASSGRPGRGTSAAIWRTPVSATTGANR
jgi:hypothetical protein